MKLGGSVLIAIGIGLFAVIRSLNPGRVLVSAISVALLMYVYVLAPKE